MSGFASSGDPPSYFRSLTGEDELRPRGEEQFHLGFCLGWEIDFKNESRFS